MTVTVSVAGTAHSVNFNLLLLERIEDAYKVGIYEVAKAFSDVGIEVPEEIKTADAERRRRIDAGDAAATDGESPIDVWMQTPEGEKAYQAWLSARSIKQELQWVSVCMGLPREQLAEQIPPAKLFAIAKDLRQQFFAVLRAMQTGEDSAQDPTSAA
jgi:hypothetical protein